MSAPVKLLVIRVEPTGVVSQRVALPVRHRGELYPEVIDREGVRTEVHEGEVSEPTTFLDSGSRVMPCTGKVEHQTRVRYHAPGHVAGFGRDP